MQFPDSEFWNFSIQFYARPGVEKSCLQLQQQYDLNVNLVLLAFWISSEKKTVLNSAQWQQLVSAAQPWQEIIKPLRKSRQLIKDSTIAWPADFQTETKVAISQVELNAEHMQQLSLEKTFLSFNYEIKDDNFTSRIFSNIQFYLDAVNAGLNTDNIYTELDQPVKIMSDQENKKISA